MTQHVHSLLRASAGTGKTFALSSRFIELLFDGVEPERILATTFTRKAAGEILDRVLQRLLEGATRPGKLEELNLSMQRPAVTREECEELLARLTRRIDRFRIRTLDAFFVSVAQLFSMDLGMTPGWSILDENDDARLREDALSALMEQFDRDELVELVRALSAKGGGRVIRSSLENAIKNGRAALLESRPGAWSCFDPGPEPKKADAQALEASLAQYSYPLKKDGSEDGRFVKAVEKLRGQLKQGDWKEILQGGLVAGLLTGNGYYKIPVDEVTLQPIADHVLANMLHDLARRNSAILQFLTRFETHYDGLKTARGGYRFEDVPARIAPLGKEGFEQLTERELDMWFRLDSRIDHLLLDEFQDTSPVQWRILHRLADEILDEAPGERSLFVVGDVKQSIYDWRGAEPRLFENLEAGFVKRRGEPPSDAYCIEPLTKSWRSSRVVLETVNRTFEGLDASHAFGEGPRATGAAEWCGSYTSHEWARDLAGAAYLVEAEATGSSATEKQAAVLNVAMDRVEAMHREAPHCTIGILLRRNKHIARCINMLRERGIRASGEGGNLLIDSAIVQHLLAALHLADHPDDTLAAFRTSNSPIGTLLGVEDGLSPAQRQAAAAKLRTRLAREGYGPLISAVARDLDASGIGAWDRRRLAQLVDLAFAYDEQASLRPGDFVKFVQEKRVEDPSAARVKVMTVHASKGLEYDAVVLPELNETAFKRGDLADMRDADHLVGPLAAVSANADESLMRSRPELAALWDSTEKRSTHEFLSLLYVAMTRAAHRLDMIVQMPTKSKKPSLKAAGVLRDALGAGDPDENGVIWSHEDSAAEWWPTAPGEATTPRAAEPAKLALRAGAAGERRESPSAHSSAARVTGARLLSNSGGRAATRGLLFHRWFEEIEWLEDFSTEDARLVELGLCIEPDEVFVRETLVEFRASLEKPAIRDVLTRGDRRVEAVWRERAFSVFLEGPDGESSLWNGVFDRVVLADGVAEILDFKTDRVLAKDVPEHAQVHAAQMSAYERVLTRMLTPDTPRIVKQLLFVEPATLFTFDD